jgi:putative Mg2+ transporter-C (MgtC) family protein
MSIEEVLRSLWQNPELEALGRIIVAGLIGVALGFEREREAKPAGIRTYGGVAIGAATFTVVGVVAFGVTDSAARVAAQIITGIGFLGAGTILHMREHVIGLTTAAGLWVVAAIGMAVGFGMYIVGIGAGLVMFVLLTLFDPDRLLRRRIRPAGDRDSAGDRDKEAPGL